MSKQNTPKQNTLFYDYINLIAMAGLLGFRFFPPKAKNSVVAVGLMASVFAADFYTRWAIRRDELQVAIDKFESDKSKKEGEANIPSKV
ncbi:uncharacterized protein LOC124848302 [Vigna umbellata]|uniref:uncharacterized protein LOC124848301 n=1 Tax=Vigna umbellata TaxID=87088 RepID=UPI001F5F6CBD|nr:uncharacterized protein LOC124848301 [Vigna umbellata]XP_047181905.1 uncharacterized protein LOC124848301 [Vigna umbellata]XP_047181906.1 uncharacterized protein LOC124848302 [Vigna umbellata]XP_047181907.1 uncharacterized protein LOC124848302 [Vigna umbellata]XP_047181908.1 uncharacterized protein LOC124848302 [Vigna umbellata]